MFKWQWLEKGHFQINMLQGEMTHMNIHSFIRVPEVTVHLGMSLKSQQVSPCLNLVLEIS